MAKQAKSANEEGKPPVLITDGSEPDLFSSDDQGNETVDVDEKKAAEPEDAAAELRKQLEDLKKNEEIHNREILRLQQEAEQARRRAVDQEVQLRQVKYEAEDNQLTAVNNAIAAANAEAAAAQRDIESAASLGDTAAQAEAYRKLSRAESKLVQLENGRDALVEQLEQLKLQQSEVAKHIDDPLERTALPPMAKQWLRDHPEYLSDRRKNAKIQALHFDVIDEGHAEFSRPYFDRLEEMLGFRKAEKKSEKGEESEGDDRDEIVSAPPSRGVPVGDEIQDGSRVRLTASEREHAKLAGVTDAEYAKQKQVLAKMKANGQYGGRG